MNIKYIIAVVLMALSAVVLAEKGPTSIGVVQIGMTKAAYLNATGINPVSCKKYKDSMESLSPDNKSIFCHNFFDGAGSTETTQVGDVLYDVVAYDDLYAKYTKNKFVESVSSSYSGFSIITAIFLKGRLISLEIKSPKIGLETLVSKYGELELVDNRAGQICQNKAGSEFKNKIGNENAVWTNGNVTALLRIKTSPPSRTCTDGDTDRYYILAEPKQVAIIDAAIRAFQAELAKQKVSDILF